MANAMQVKYAGEHVFISHAGLQRDSFAVHLPESSALPGAVAGHEKSDYAWMDVPLPDEQPTWYC